MIEENVDAVGCFLEYIYTGEYFPQRKDEGRGLASDDTQPDIDETGEQLLKHYTLASKLGMTALKTLAHSKIHCVNSSAKGEIVYARYVYATTPLMMTRFDGQLPHFGPTAVTSCARMQKTSSDRCVWNSPNLVSTC